MITIIDRNGNYAEFPQGGVIAIFAITLAFILAFYILRSIGLYKIAKKENVKPAFLSFIPFAWTYVAGKIAGRVSFFGKVINKFEIILLVIFTVAEVMMIAINFVAYFPLIGYYLQGGEIILSSYSDLVPKSFERFWTGTCYVQNIIYPYSNPDAEATVVNVFSYVYRVLNIISIVLLVYAYIGIFKKYAPRRLILLSVLSAFGFFGPIVFAVRNREPVDYAAYVRSIYNGYYNNYQNNNGNNQGENHSSGSSDGDPFSEFSEKQSDNNKNEDPFSEFSDDKKDDDK